jgi:hypothetical protein
MSSTKPGMAYKRIAPKDSIKKRDERERKDRLEQIFLSERYKILVEGGTWVAQKQAAFGPHSIPPDNEF